MHAASTPPAGTAENPLVGIKELSARWGISRSTIYREMKKGNLPKPIQVSSNRCAWPESQLVEALAAKREAA